MPFLPNELRANRVNRGVNQALPPKLVNWMRKVFAYTGKSVSLPVFF